MFIITTKICKPWWKWDVDDSDGDANYANDDDNGVLWVWNILSQDDFLSHHHICLSEISAEENAVDLRIRLITEVPTPRDLTHWPLENVVVLKKCKFLY